MKLADLKKVIQEYQYFEDTNIIDTSVASVIANSLKLGDPVWLIIIGASSGGKSQIIRPLSLSNKKFIHKIDDLTENTFLSGAKVKGGGNTSLLLREGGIGKHGIISISDLTVLLSKGGDSTGVILSQFRMLFDGEMTKHSGNQAEALHWEGYLGVIAGSTPSIYKAFENFSDLGERFIYYRMKEFDAEKATALALSRTLYGSELNDKLADAYGEYIKHMVTTYSEHGDIPITDEVKKRLITISRFSETARTAVSYDWQGTVDRLPTPAYPMRVALQLVSITKAIILMKHNETGSYELGEEELSILDWVGYSLANEEKRACLKIIAHGEYDVPVSTQAIADEIGLDTNVVKNFVQNLSAVGILKRSATSNLTWQFKNKDDYALVRRIEGFDDIVQVEERDVSDDEINSLNDVANEAFDAFNQTETGTLL